MDQQHLHLSHLILVAATTKLLLTLLPALTLDLPHSQANR